MNAIETQGLTREFNGRVAVDNLTLTVPSGTVFGFLGPNGAGKTTTVRMLTALIGPTHGTALVMGKQIGRDNHAIRKIVGLLTETPGLYDAMNAWQNLLFSAQLYDLDEAKAKQQVERYLTMLGLWERRNEPVGGFSKGMRQKLAIARALLHEPQVVFLDEPTSGLDPEAARTVREFVKMLRTEGRTIFLTTHNLPEAEELCDLMGVFRGRLLKMDSPDNLRTGLFGRGTQVQVVGEAARWQDIARALPFASDVHTQKDILSVKIDDPDTHNPALVSALVAAGAQVRYVQPLAHSLEEVYLELVK